MGERQRYALTILGTCLILSGCGILGYVDEPDRIVLWGSGFTIAWDEPATSYGTSDLSEYILYRQAYPNRIVTSWVEIGRVTESAGPVYRVDAVELAPGSYEFGVRAVDSEGRYSEIHRSTDPQAEPATGWYIEWLGGGP